MPDPMFTPGGGGGGKPPPKPYDPLSSIQAPKPSPKPYDPLSSIQAPKPPPKPYDPLSSIQAPKPSPKPYDPLSSIQAPKPPPDLYYDPLSSIQAPAEQTNTVNVPNIEAWQNHPYDPVYSRLVKHFGRETVDEMYFSEPKGMSDEESDEEQFDHLGAALAHLSGFYTLMSYTYKVFHGFSLPPLLGDVPLAAYQVITGDGEGARDTMVGSVVSMLTLGIPVVPFLLSKMDNSPYAEDPFFYAEFPPAFGSNRTMYGEIYQNREEAMYRGYQYEYFNPDLRVGHLNPTVDLLSGFNIVEDLSKMDASEVDIGSYVDEWITVVGGWKAATTDFAGSGEEERKRIEAYMSFELFSRYVQDHDIDLDNVADDNVLPHLVQAMAQRGVVLPNEVIAVTLLEEHYTLSNELPSGLLPGQYQSGALTPKEWPIDHLYEILSADPESPALDFQALVDEDHPIARWSKAYLGHLAGPVFRTLQNGIKEGIPGEELVQQVIDDFTYSYEVNYQGTGFATLEDSGGPNLRYQDLSVQEHLDRFFEFYPDFHKRGNVPVDFFVSNR